MKKSGEQRYIDTPLFGTVCPLRLDTVSSTLTRDTPSCWNACLGKNAAISAARAQVRAEASKVSQAKRMLRTS